LLPSFWLDFAFSSEASFLSEKLVDAEDSDAVELTFVELTGDAGP
jgi:hypothetical protein